MARRECPTCGCAFRAPRRPPSIVTDNGVTYVIARSRVRPTRILHECRLEPPQVPGDPAGQPARPRPPTPTGYTADALELPIAN